MSYLGPILFFLCLRHNSKATVVMNSEVSRDPECIYSKQGKSIIIVDDHQFDRVIELCAGDTSDQCFLKSSWTWRKVMLVSRYSTEPQRDKPGEVPKECCQNIPFIPNAKLGFRSLYTFKTVYLNTPIEIQEDRIPRKTECG